MVAKKREAQKMNIRMSDRLKVLELRTILAYEAEMRGLPVGQTCAELVLEGADIDSYPQEMRDHLAEIEARARKRALERMKEASDPAGD